MFTPDGDVAAVVVSQNMRPVHVRQQLGLITKPAFWVVFPV